MTTLGGGGNLEDPDRLSCREGSERWRCEDLDGSTIIRCYSSKPCSEDMHHPEILDPRGPGSKITPVLRDLAATTSAGSTSPSMSTATAATSTSTNMLAVAGGAAAVGIVVTALVGMLIFYCRRRKAARKLEPYMQITSYSKSSFGLSRKGTG